MFVLNPAKSITSFHLEAVELEIWTVELFFYNQVIV